MYRLFGSLIFPPLFIRCLLWLRMRHSNVNNICHCIQTNAKRLVAFFAPLTPCTIGKHCSPVHLFFASFSPVPACLVIIIFLKYFWSELLVDLIGLVTNVYIQHQQSHELHLNKPFYKKIWFILMWYARFFLLRLLAYTLIACIKS